MVRCDGNTKYVTEWQQTKPLALFVSITRITSHFVFSSSSVLYVASAPHCSLEDCDVWVSVRRKKMVRGGVGKCNSLALSREDK